MYLIVKCYHEESGISVIDDMIPMYQIQALNASATRQTNLTNQVGAKQCLNRVKSHSETIYWLQYGSVEVFRNSIFLHGVGDDYVI